MAYTENVIAVERETKLLVGLESTPGTQIAASSCSLVLLHAAGQASQLIRLIDDPQFRDTRSRLLPIVASYDAGKYSFPCLIKGVAGSGTPVASEIDPFLQALMGQASETDTTQFGSTPHRAYHLLGVSPGGTVYPSFTVWFKTGHQVFYFVGGTCNQADFEIMGNDLAKVTFSGEFMRHGYAGTDYAVGGGTGTSLVVNDARKYMLGDTGDKVYIQFLAADGTLSPAGGLAVSAVDYNTNTLTLDSSGTWTDNDVVVPYLPAGTEVGVPLYGKYGLLRMGTYVDKTYANLPAGTQVVNGARVTVTNGIRYHPDLKDNKNYPTEYVVPSFREVKGELQLFMYRNVPVFNYKAQSDPLVPDYVIIPTQDKSGSQGKIIQLHIPRAVWETPNPSGEDEKNVSIPFRGIATTDYDDEFSLVYIGG